MKDDDVRFGQGGSLPRDLYLRGRGLFKLFWFAALSPLILLFAWLMPEALLLDIARASNDLFWAHLKRIQIEACAPQCRLMAYGMIGIPLSWLATSVIAFWAIPMTVRNWQAGEDGLRVGAVPYGRTAKGEIKQPPSLLLGITYVVFTGTLLVGGIWLLYLLAGSTQTISRGREIPSVVIGFWTTGLMGLTQLVAAAFVMAVTFCVLNAKKLLYS
ncbi:MAG: hypothetical protein Q8K93_25555 [Reyranella sp.]|nr:hypothetical protein [Thiobacillus sp.]MDP1965562.1 hypothetical protein [Reyranella sp.]